MNKEIVLVVGIVEGPGGIEVESHERARELLKNFGIFNTFMVEHLNVRFTIFYPGNDIDPTNFEVAKKVLKAIHFWAIKKELLALGEAIQRSCKIDLLSQKQEFDSELQKIRRVRG